MCISAELDDHQSSDRESRYKLTSLQHDMEQCQQQLASTQVLLEQTTTQLQALQLAQDTLSMEKADVERKATEVQSKFAEVGAN